MGGGGGGGGRGGEEGGGGVGLRSSLKQPKYKKRGEKQTNKQTTVNTGSVNKFLRNA